MNKEKHKLKIQPKSKLTKADLISGNLDLQVKLKASDELVEFYKVEAAHYKNLIFSSERTINIIHKITSEVKGNWLFKIWGLVKQILDLIFEYKESKKNYEIVYKKQILKK